MIPILEIGIIIFLIFVQSIFGVGLLLFGTPSFLILGYDFANTINILMPVSITISILQFYKSKVRINPKDMFLHDTKEICSFYNIPYVVVKHNSKECMELIKEN